VLLLTLRGLRAHKRRMLATVLAVVLGVAFMAGARVLTDTMSASLSGVLTDAESGTDVLVRAEPAFDGWNGAVRGPLPADLVDELAQTDEVAAAAARIEGFAQVLGRDGEPVDDLASGAAPVGVAWTDDEALNPFRLVDGRGPTAADEIVIDRRTATAAELSVGDRTSIITRETPRPATVVGIATFGEAESRAGTSTVLLPPDIAQAELGEAGTVSAIALRAVDGVGQQALLDAVTPVLADGQEALTGSAYAEEAAAKGDADVEFFSTFITVFAVVSLLVGAFIINNTFAILVAQRVRELALVRALGGSRSRCAGPSPWRPWWPGSSRPRSASRRHRRRGRPDRPAGGARRAAARGPLAVRPGSLLLAFASGSSSPSCPRCCRPACGEGAAGRRDAGRRRGAGRHQPQARRDGRAAHRRRHGAGGPGDPGGAVPPVLGGALALLFGVTTLGPVIASRSVRALGSWLPRARGIRGTLARENAVRNPKRTASTAAALMVGVSLVSAITCFAASGKQSVAGSFDEDFRGDLAVDTGAWMHGGVSADLAATLEGLPELSSVAARRLTEAQIDGELTELAGWSAASPTCSPSRCCRARRRGWAATGWRSRRTSPRTADGRSATRCRWCSPAARPATSRSRPSTSSRTGSVAPSSTGRCSSRPCRRRWTSRSTSRPRRRRRRDRTHSAGAGGRAVGERDGARPGRAARGLHRLLRRDARHRVRAARAGGRHRAHRHRQHPRPVGRGADARARDAARGRRDARAGALGRAVGGRAHRLVRLAGRTGVGLFLGWSLVFAVSQAVADAQFVMPWAQLAVVVAVASVCGVLAALLPARRAARLDVLQAISTA
jgi:putative ABC transport system permease protein